MNPEYAVDTEPAADTPLAQTRPMYWSVRRELWENRFLFIAPAIVSAVALVATFFAIANAVLQLRGADAARVQAAVALPLRSAPATILFGTIVVGLFYCLDALHGERRDRTLLFWKSLPVSDRTAVLAKAAIPLAVLPLLAYALSVVTQVILLIVSTLVLAGFGFSAAPLWVGFFEGLLIMLYGLIAHALWYAPVYGWLLLLSAWARRAVVLWAVLPPLVLLALERILSRTRSFAGFLQYRAIGAMREAFLFQPPNAENADRLSQLTPGRFLVSPGLWLGLLFAALCLAAAIRLRRRREPV
ncbi:MAG TPA: ABC transporter permease [Thermoanaerobaculia bacterium]